MRKHPVFVEPLLFPQALVSTPYVALGLLSTLRLRLGSGLASQRSPTLLGFTRANFLISTRAITQSGSNNLREIRESHLSYPFFRFGIAFCSLPCRAFPSAIC